MSDGRKKLLYVKIVLPLFRAVVNLKLFAKTENDIDRLLSSVSLISEVYI